MSLVVWSKFTCHLSGLPAKLKACLMQNRKPKSSAYMRLWETLPQLWIATARHIHSKMLQAFKNFQESPRVSRACDLQVQRSAPWLRRCCTLAIQRCVSQSRWLQILFQVWSQSTVNQSLCLARVPCNTIAKQIKFCRLIIQNVYSTVHLWTFTSGEFM